MTGNTFIKMVFFLFKNSGFFSCEILKKEETFLLKGVLFFYFLLLLSEI